MSGQELVCHIINNFDSRFLVPLSYKYDTETWNAAMQEAFEKMGLVEEQCGENMFDRLKNHIGSLTADEMAKLFVLHNVMLERMQAYLQDRTKENEIGWCAARKRLKEFVGRIGFASSPQKSGAGPEGAEHHKDAGDSLAPQDNTVSSDHSLGFWLKKISPLQSVTP
jgi:hypothetical protein